MDEGGSVSIWTLLGVKPLRGRTLRADDDKIIGAGGPKKTEHHRVHQTEDRRVRADAKRQRKDRDRGEARVAAQRTPGEPKVGAKIVEALQSPAFAAAVLGGLHRPEFHARAACGFVGAQAGSHKIRRIGFDVRAQFRLHFGLEVLAPEDLHDSSGTALSTVATTPEKFAQASASVLSWRRPAGVRR